MKRSCRLLAGLALALIGGLPRLATAQELMIWHDKGDDGLHMIEQMAAAYKQDHPTVVVKSLSMPTEQWFSRSIAALNTNTAPDILFNDNNRIVQMQQTTGKLADLQPQFDQIPATDRKSINAGDIAASTFKGRLIQIPFQRVITAWGVRKRWLEEAGEPYPKTWDDVLRVARKIQTSHKDTYGIAMQAGNAGSMTGGGINLFVYGSGATHALVDEKGEVVIDKPEVAKPTIEYLKLYTEYKLVSPDTVNHSFTDMYQLIEGGRVGMFRVGNWNVGKWDKQPPAGDYVIGAYPSFGSGQGAMVVSTVRGMAVPENARNKDAAKEFVKFIVGKQAQQFSLDNMGGVVRSDLDTSNVTPGLKPFLAPDARFQVDDFLTSVFPWYLKLQDSYYAMLIQAVSSPPKDWDGWMRTTAAKLREELAVLKSKG